MSFFTSLNVIFLNLKVIFYHFEGRLDNFRKHPYLTSAVLASLERGLWVTTVSNVLSVCGYDLQYNNLALVCISCDSIYILVVPTNYRHSRQMGDGIVYTHIEETGLVGTRIGDTGASWYTYRADRG